MSFLDKLSTLLSIDLSGLKSLTVKLLSDNKTQTQIINAKDNAKVLVVNINNLDSEDQKKALAETIKSAFDSGEQPLVIEENTLKTLEEFKVADSQSDNKSTIDYFRGKIPSTDIEILRASILVASLYDNGNAVDAVQRKHDIVQRYGDKGRNICNLFSADYFSNLIKPIYEEMSSSSNFDPTKFQSVYNIIVTESPYAIFIHSGMSSDAVKKSVLERIDVSKKYGTSYLNIHGIGRDNVEKISDLIKQLTQEGVLQKLPEIQSGSSYIIIKIWL